MKKNYIRPAAELVELSAQGMLALSNNISIYTSGDAPSVDGLDIMTNRCGWSCEAWSIDDEE